MVTHSGEVSGSFDHSVFPAKKLGIAVLSNEDNVGLTSAAATQIATALLEARSEMRRTTRKWRGILAGFGHGRIDRTRFTGTRTLIRRGGARGLSEVARSLGKAASCWTGKASNRAAA